MFGLEPSDRASSRLYRAMVVGCGKWKDCRRLRQLITGHRAMHVVMNGRGPFSRQDRHDSEDAEDFFSYALSVKGKVASSIDLAAIGRNEEDGRPV